MTNSAPQNPDQNIGISGGDLDNVQLGGQAGNDIYQAGGHVIKDSTLILNSISEDVTRQKVLSLLKQREDSLKTDFQEILKHVGKLISELRQVLESQLQAMPPESSERISRLVEEIKQITNYQFAIESIEDDLDSCFEAADWLRENIKEISVFTASSMFHRSGFLVYLKTPNLSRGDVEKRFESDIRVYLEWIYKYIRDGAEPENDLDKEDSINFDFDAEAYREAFIFITDEVIDPRFSKLSDAAANMLASYVNNFLINDDNQWQPFSID